MGPQGHLEESTGRRRVVVGLIAVLVSSWWIVSTARPAGAAIFLNPSEGPRSSSVSVAVTGVDPVACRLLFDGVQLASSLTCVSGLSFVVPSGAEAGAHTVSVVAGGGGIGGAAAGQTIPLGTATFTVRIVATTDTTLEVTTTTETEQTTTTEAVEPVAPPVGTVPQTQPVQTTRPVQSTLPTTATTSSPPSQPEPVVDPPVIVAPPTETAPATCSPAPAEVEGLAVNPASGSTGRDLSLAFAVRPAGNCSVRPMVIAIDGVVVSGPVAPGPGPVTAGVKLPQNTAPGTHRVSLVLADDPSIIVASTPVEVTAPGDSSSLPLVAGLIGLAALAGTAVVVVRAKSGGTQPPVAGAADPCTGVKVAAEDARLRAEEARAAVSQAQYRARAAEERLAVLRDQAPGESVDAAGGREESRPALPFALPVLSSRRTGKPFLVEHENPHAPRRPNGKRGWYRTQRTTPVRAVVVQTAGGGQAGRSAGEVASALSFAPRPAAAHVVVDGDGVVDLLPDDHVAVQPGDGADEAGIVMMVATGADGAVDDAAVRYAASWCTPRARSYHLPTRRLTAEEWSQGEAGFVDARDVPGASPGDGPDFPWDRFLGLLRQHHARAIPGILPGRDAVPARNGAGDAKESEAQAQAEAEAEGARKEAENAEQRARDAEQRYEALVRECATCEARDIPPPEELVVVEPEPEEAAEDGGYYLLEHQNPSGLLRENGKHGWYYPSRSQPIRGIVVHTAESFDAEGVAAYLAVVDRPAAAHVVIDTERSVALLPDEATAFHASGGNSMGLGIEIAYRAANWGEQPATEAMLLSRSALWCGLRARKYDIPVRRVTVEEWEAGASGFISHAELDPANRSDPGPDFPWDRFLDLTARIAGGSADNKEPAVATPSATGPGARGLA
mgnify:CR=1 FL=1